ncbi:hypothetical protein H0H93_016707, partial [Arthromyces matolae]
ENLPRNSAQAARDPTKRYRLALSKWSLHPDPPQDAGDRKKAATPKYKHGSRCLEDAAP